MQPTAYPMPGTMVPMPGTMAPMPGTMVSMPSTMVSMPGVMYPTVNPNMYNVNVANPGMAMVYTNGGYMANMYQPNPVYINPTISNPNVPITNIPNVNVPNVNVPNTSVSCPNVPISNLNNNQGNTNRGQAPPSLLSRDPSLIGQLVASNNGIINVYFNASTGSQVVINIKEDTPFKEAVEKYCEKIKLDKKFIEMKKIIFIYLGTQMDPQSTEPIKSLKISNLSKIDVFDQGNVIGA